jgi:hypothetical protein
MFSTQQKRFNCQKNMFNREKNMLRSQKNMFNREKNMLQKQENMFFPEKKHGCAVMQRLFSWQIPYPGVLALIIFLILFFNSHFSVLYSQEIRKTAVYDEQLKSLQMRIGGEPCLMPVIEMNGGEKVEISFDAFGHDYKRFAYAVEYCDADWRLSALSQMEYMDGMPGLTINDFAGSTNTTVEYTNYRLEMPNDDVRLKISGNYVVRIYPEGEPAHTLLTACFSVVESQVVIDGGVSGNTLLDYNQGRQQVDFSILLRNLAVQNPQTELKVFVYQNGRKDNAVSGLNPTSILRDRLVYERNRKLIFEAGNEYRRFEFLSNMYNGIGVENIRFFNPFYHVTLQSDMPRRGQVHRYDEDHDGRYYIRCRNCSEADREADYCFVHFSLKMSELPGGTLHLLGDAFNNMLDERSRLTYNSSSGQYEKYVLLKQGHYNYSYVFLALGQSAGESFPVEGSFYQTSNEYDIFVYFRPFGVRYDKLVGVRKIRE